MSQIPVNTSYNIQNGTPLYNYQGAVTQPIAQNQQTPSVSVSQADGTKQIYQYPQASLYDTSKQGGSGVNIYIYNPSAIGGPSSNSNANTTYNMPGANGQPAAAPVVTNNNNNINNPAPVASEPAQPAAPIANTPINTTEQTDEKPQKTKKVVELTDDYIKTLESYLRNANSDLRKTGIKELIKRYEEDTSRYNDPALAALLNIALQDPEPANRIFAMAPIASGSATGDENTIKLLQKLQTSDKMYGQEAKMANDSLLNAVQVKKEIPDYSPDKK